LICTPDCTVIVLESGIELFDVFVGKHVSYIAQGLSPMLEAASAMVEKQNMCVMLNRFCFLFVGFVSFGEWQEMKVKTVASNFTGWLPGFGFTG